MIEAPKRNIIALDDSPNADVYCTLTGFVSGTYLFKVTSIKGSGKPTIDVTLVKILFYLDYYHNLDNVFRKS